MSWGQLALQGGSFALFLLFLCDHFVLQLDSKFLRQVLFTMYFPHLVHSSLISNPIRANISPILPMNNLRPKTFSSFLTLHRELAEPLF